MRLVNTRLGMEIELYENQVLNLTIETPERFAEVVYNVSKQVEGKKETLFFQILKRNSL